MTKPYTLTPEFFARTRERLARRKAELIEHLKEVQAIDERIARLDADERLAADLATRYEADIAADLPKRRVGRPKRPTPSRPVPSGRPWTPEEDFLVMARGDDAELARQMGRKESSIAKRRRVVRARPADGAAETTNSPRAAETGERRSGQSAAAFAPDTDPSDSGSAREAPSDSGIGGRGESYKTPVEIGESPASPGPVEPHDSEPSSSEKPGIYELTPTPQKALSGNERQFLRAPPPKPGRVVEGIVDDGPGRPRYYHPIFDATREPR